MGKLVLDKIEFPRCLHGDSKSVRRVMQSWAKRAWKSGRWDSEPLHLIPVTELPGRIMVQRPRFGLSPYAHESHWRVRWFSESSQLFKEWSTLPSTDREFSLLTNGFQHIWFVVGWMSFESAPFAFGAMQNKFHRRLLDAFVYWLPELDLLSPYFADESATDADRTTAILNVCGIFIALARCGYRIADKWEDRFLKRGLIGWLSADGIVVPAGNRFQLVPQRARAKKKS